jgi:cobalt-zinc-cadmium efflux system outer membrane protein
MAHYPERSIPPARRALFCAALLATLGTATPGNAGTDGDALTAEDAVRLSLERNPAVQAAQARLEAAVAGARGAGAPFNPQAELAPGVGFTNGNALLSQQIDIGGRRSAQSRTAAGLRSAAEAELALARLQAAAGARAAYFDLVRARAVEAAAAEASLLARQIRDAVRRRVEIGEAPQVQATRADIEVARVEQDVARARGEAQGRLAVLNLLLGRSADAAISASEALAAPDAPAETSALVEQALRSRPELAAGRGMIEARRGEVAVARTQRRPELFAELASDVWSVDRDPLNSRNIGLQARLAFPLFDRGRLRAEVDRARAGVREQEAELASTARALEIEIRRAAAELTAARSVALGYQTAILPRTQELLRATRSGFENGLTSFLEVLEAQRLARQTQTEYLNALFEATRARIALDRALGALPGLAPTPVTPERSPSK